MRERLLAAPCVAGPETVDARNVPFEPHEDVAPRIRLERRLEAQLFQRFEEEGGLDRRLLPDALGVVWPLGAAEGYPAGPLHLSSSRKVSKLIVRQLYHIVSQLKMRLLGL